MRALSRTARLAAAGWLGAAALASCRPEPSAIVRPVASSEPGSPTPSEPAALEQPPGSAWVTPSSAPRPSEEQLRAAWAPLVVRPEKPYRRVLYTWTDPSQIEYLRASRQLLVKTDGDGHRMSLYFQSLWEHYDESTWARLLMNPPFHRVRYAWPRPWATRLGGDGKPYGDVLVQVTLKPEALLVTLTTGPGGPPVWAVYDRENRVLSEAEARQQAPRVGAVLHLHEQAEGQSFREYVVCNEAMVESWSIGTDEIRATLAGDVAALEALEAFSQGREGWDEPMPLAEHEAWRGGVVAAWRGAPAAQVRDIYGSSLSFANLRYEPSGPPFAKLLRATKQAYQDEGSLTHRPGLAPLARVATPPRRPPVVVRRAAGCTPDSTFSCIVRLDYPCRGPSGAVVACR